MQRITGIIKKKGRHAVQGYKDREFIIDEKGVFQYGRGFYILLHKLTRKNGNGSQDLEMQFKSANLLIGLQLMKKRTFQTDKCLFQC